MAKINIAVFQNDSILMDKSAQLASLSATSAEASNKGADLLLCPELYMTGYYLKDRVTELAEPVDGPFISQARQLAASCNIMLVFGYPEASNGNIYNSAIVIGNDGKIINNFRKLHLPGEFENSNFKKGHKFVNFDVKGINTSILICYDVEYPEAVRKLALDNTQLLLVPTALSSPYPIVATKLIPARAFENGIFIAYADFCNEDDGLAYAGLSCIVDPHGEDLARAGVDETIIYAQIDSDEIVTAQSALPYLKQRRPELY